MRAYICNVGKSGREQELSRKKKPASHLIEDTHLSSSLNS